MPTIKTGIRFSKKQPLSEQELRQAPPLLAAPHSV